MMGKIVCLSVIFFAFAAVTFAVDTNTLDVREKPVAFVIAPQQFRDEELFVPKTILEKAGYKTIVAGPVVGKAIGMLGGTAEITVPIEELSESEISALVIVGGAGSPKYLWNDKALQRLALAMVNAKKPTAAICLSPVVLARAGVLKGRRAVAWKSPETSSEFEAAGVIADKKHCVVDDFIVTADGPDAANEFAEAILTILKSKVH